MLFKMKLYLDFHRPKPHLKIGIGQNPYRSDKVIKGNVPWFEFMLQLRTNFLLKNSILPYEFKFVFHLQKLDISPTAKHSALS